MKKALIVFFLFFVMANCSTKTSEPTAGTTSPTTVTTTPTTLPYENEFTGTVKDITVSGLTQGNQVYLMIHNTGTSTSTTLYDPITLYGENIESLSSADTFRSNTTQPVLKDKVMPKISDIYPDKSVLKQPVTRSAAPSYDYGQSPDDYIIGQKKLGFWAMDGDGNNIQIQATLKAVGKNTTAGTHSASETDGYAYIFVEDTELQSGRISDATIQQIANAYNGATGIYQQMTQMIGYEWGGGTSGNGGIDGNKNVYILLADLKELNIGGYFFSIDSLDESEEILRSGYHSNEKQMLYINTKSNFDANQILTPQTAITILIHEFQHMINLNQKFANDGAFDRAYEEDEVWLNEACAMAMQDIFTKKFITDQDYEVYRIRIPSYLNYPEMPLLMTGSDYAQYYLFIAYLMRNVSPQIAKEVISGAGRDYTGKTALVKALNAVGNTEGFDVLYKKWKETIIYDDNTTAWKGYPAKAEGDISLDGFTLQSLLNIDSSFSSRTYPNYSYFRTSYTTHNVIRDYSTRIFAGKVTSSGAIKIHIINGSANFSYKLIVKG